MVQTMDIENTVRAIKEVTVLEPQSGFFVCALSQEGSLTQPGILPPGEGWKSGDIFP